MKYALFIAALLAAKLASAQTVFTVSCEDYYPEPESPMSTTIIAEVTRDANGGFAGLHCRAAEGDPKDACNIFDGGCCACNMARGFTPECSVTVNYGESTTAAHCLNMFPCEYYGSGCPIAWDTLVAEAPQAVVKRNGKRVKTKHNK